MKTRLVLLLAVPLLLLAGGCTNVQPWQRGALAEYIMQPDRGSLDRALTEHLFYSREASTGGRGIGGGGCGCN